MMYAQRIVCIDAAGIHKCAQFDFGRLILRGHSLARTMRLHFNSAQKTRLCENDDHSGRNEVSLLSTALK
jgi:hypothetical protein